MAQPDRAAVQQTQELAQGRDTLRQDQGILPRLRRARLSQTMDTLCPRNLVEGPYLLLRGQWFLFPYKPKIFSFYFQQMILCIRNSTTQ